MFSVSTIYSVKDFLEFIKDHSIAADKFLDAFGKFQYESATKILELSTECGWIHLRPNGQIEISERGSLIALKGYREALLTQLEDMILIYNPPWASFLPKGRTETLSFLPDDAAQCFKEAGFEGEMTDELISFWDRLSLAYRNYNQKQQLETGRTGEKLSIIYETMRVKKKPVWQSIESNLSGYDILSTVDESNSENLLIEVKSSTSKVENANFYITKNEWRTAEISFNYCFHLWIVGKVNYLFVVEPRIIKDNIAQNMGQGEWQKIRIPYLAIIDKENPIFVI